MKSSRQEARQILVSNYLKAVRGVYFTNLSSREMVKYIYRSQSQAIRLQLLSGPSSSRIFLPLLQGWKARSTKLLAGAGCPQCIRTHEATLPRHEGSVQWVQATDRERDEQGEIVILLSGVSYMGVGKWSHRLMGWSFLFLLYQK